jgi:hypothetical protein
MTRRRARLPVLVAWVLFAALAAPAGAALPNVKSRALARSHGAAASALAHARALRAGRGVVTGRELTPALAELSARYAALDAAERREADRLLARPTEGAGDPEAHGYTVPEHAPFCTTNFCMHWVTTTADAPPLADGDMDDVPDTVEDMAAEFQAVRTSENGTLGWTNPVSDGALGGGAGKVDVYLADLGPSLLGYAAADAAQADVHHKFGYVVMDNDYAEQADPVGAMDVTAAHEYNHLLQFAYDAAQDTWMMESTAVWMEDRVHDDIDRYLGFIPAWAALDEVPLAKTYADKHYGSAVWNMWLDAQYGVDLIRAAWAGSAGDSPQSFAPGAYAAALTAGSHDGFSASFVSFTADLAEWRTGSVFPEGAAYAAAQRRGNLQAGGLPVSPALDHTSYALYTVPQPAAGWPAVLRLDGELPAGVAGGLALVGRTGTDPAAGTVTKVVQQLPDGGQGSVQLENPSDYGRITAVLANADMDTTGFQGGDWVFSADAQTFTASAGASGSTSEAPVNTGAPTVSGVARDGSALSASNGTWTGSAPMQYGRQWRRCAGDGGGCEDIAGATGAQYMATEDDVGHALRVRVDASNDADAAFAESAPTAAVAAKPPSAPANSALPSVSGIANDGETLTAHAGTWTGSPPPGLTRAWMLCSDPTDVGTCEVVASGSDTIELDGSHVGRFVRVRETAQNTAGTATAFSEATEPVSADAPQNTAAPTVTGDAVAGGELGSGLGSWTGTAPVALARRWQRCASGPLTCADIPGETGERYRLGSADVLSQVRVVVRASNAAGALELPSALSPVVRPAPTTAAIKTPPRRAKLASALAGKFAVTVDCTGPCAVSTRLALSRPAARKLGVPRVPARGSKRLAAAGRATVKLAFSAKTRKKLRNTRKLTGTLVVESRDAGGALIASRRGKLTLGR